MAENFYPPMPRSPVTELAENISDTQDTIPVTNAAKLPDGPNKATIGGGEESETVKYNDKDGNTLIGCTRGFDPSNSAKAWDSGTPVARVLTAQDIKVMQDRIEQLETDLEEFEGMEVHDNTYHNPNMATASDLTNHEGDTTNPHSVTASQANAAPDSHDNTNHSPNFATASDLTSHEGDTTNPHSVTASQANAAPDSHDNTNHNPNFATASDLTSHKGETADTDNVHGLREDKVIIGDGSAGAGYLATAIGKDASAAGPNSVAIGRGADAGGSGAISIGPQASDAVPDGSIGIGFSCNIESDATNSVGLGDDALVQGYNSMALGSDAYVSINNGVRIGDSNVTSIGGYADWSNVSDERDKIDIESSEHGLNIITKLNPIKYRLDPRKRYEEKDDDGKVTKHKKDGSRANEKYSYGFSAQELVEALKDTDLDIVDDADPDQLAVREGKLVPVLVKAVQELAVEVERLKEVK